MIKGRFVGIVAVGAALGLGGAACAAGPSVTAKGDVAPEPVRLTISPGNGAPQARPDRGVTVSARGGRLSKVTVRADGKPAAGRFGSDRTSWKTRWTLRPGTSYTVTATGTNGAGRTTTTSSRFTTAKAARTFEASLDWILQQNQDDTYGVGLPIIVNFDRPIFNKARVERALQVRAEKPVPGAWRWTTDRQVVYRTKRFWPAHQKVTLAAHLAGVRGAKGVYGVRNLTRAFHIGAARVSKVDIKKKRMTVSVDGRKVKSYGISAGMATTREYTTTTGTHLTMEKAKLVIMESPGRKPGDPGYYKEPIGYAVRISNSGEYVHKTDGQEYCLGRQNCSHGCVRQPADQAIWFYKNVQPADVVITKGTDRKLEWNNGWSFYQMPWKLWIKGSALRGHHA